MKKWNMMMLVLALLALPAAGLAQDLPELFSAVYTGLGEGLEQGAMQAMAAMDQELTLEMIPSGERIEEGQTLLLTVKAGNPRPQAENVKITLDLPKRLTTAQESEWEAALPAAEMDPQTGVLVPSETVFVREIALVPGGESEETEITAEMSMGTRFYRTKAGLSLCVPDVEAKACVADVENGRVQPGDAFAYRLEIVNAGNAAKETAVELTLPSGVTARQPLPAGFRQEGSLIRGSVCAQAAGDAPSMTELVFPVTASDTALEGDEDARRLLAGALLVDGERVALPRVEVCGAKISAALLPDRENLEAGETAKLSVVVVNAGLAAADVEISCVLPQGLTLCSEGENAKTESGEKQEAEKKEAEEKTGDREKDEEKPVVPEADDGGAASGTMLPAAAPAAAPAPENRTLVFDLHMDAARETDGGVIANTQVLEIPVKAAAPQDDMQEALLGATLAWSVDDRPAQLGEAIALRVYRDTFMGVSKEEWNGVFWAGVLLLAAVAFLYAAARRDSRSEDFCCE